MEKEQIKALMEGNPLRAYLYSEDRAQIVIFENTPANIANFLAGHQYDFSEIILTDMVDQLILNARYGMIDRCPDQNYLQEILSDLVPLQIGVKEPGEVMFVDYDDVEEYYEELEQGNFQMELE